MEHPQSLGRLIDDLELKHQPVPGEEVLGAVVLLKVREADGGVSLRSVWSDDISWMERVGMHTAAAQTEMPAAPADPWLDELPPSHPLHSVDTGPQARGDTRPGTRTDADAELGEGQG